MQQLQCFLGTRKQVATLRGEPAAPVAFDEAGYECVTRPREQCRYRFAEPQTDDVLDRLMGPRFQFQFLYRCLDAGDDLVLGIHECSVPVEHQEFYFFHVPAFSQLTICRGQNGACQSSRIGPASGREVSATHAQGLPERSVGHRPGAR